MLKLTLPLVAAGAALTALAATPQPAPKHVVLTPAEVAWGPGPASLPSGAQGAVLYGDPTKEGPFALRLKFPKGYRIPAHTHPKPEIITVISGAFLLSTAADHSSHMKPLTAGSFVAMEPGLVHQAGADEETVVQLTSVGPWGITYVNPNDDPRQRTH
jgi:quercetin dioxygenase-like cupin family protein